MVKQKKTFDELARINARLKKRRNRASARPPLQSCIQGRSLTKVQEPTEPEAVEAEVVEQADTEEN